MRPFQTVGPLLAATLLHVISANWRCSTVTSRVWESFWSSNAMQSKAKKPDLIAQALNCTTEATSWGSPPHTCQQPDNWRLSSALISLHSYLQRLQSHCAPAHRALAQSELAWPPSQLVLLWLATASRQPTKEEHRLQSTQQQQGSPHSWDSYQDCNLNAEGDTEQIHACLYRFVEQLAWQAAGSSFEIVGEQRIMATLQQLAYMPTLDLRILSLIMMSHIED